MGEYKSGFESIFSFFMIAIMKIYYLNQNKKKETTKNGSISIILNLVK